MNLASAAVAGAVYFAIILAAIGLERFAPVEQNPAPDIRFNLVLSAANMAIHALLVPALSIFTVAAVNAAGGGWITLPSSGFGLLAGLAAYTFTVDGLEYLFHRAQHRFPLLWSMHSLHHSDVALSAASTGRHYWADQGIKMLSIYLLLGVVFRANAEILSLYGLVSLYNVFSHMNLRVGLGRMSFLVNSPQYHRIHHSALPQHRDHNFAALFPIFDVVFGTYLRPRDGEYPPTGLGDNEPPPKLVNAMIWPPRLARRG